jgi:hypothetical protein
MEEQIHYRPLKLSNPPLFTIVEIAISNSAIRPDSPKQGDGCAEYSGLVLERRRNSLHETDF